MERISHPLSPLLQAIVEHLDIPKSLYEKAAARHLSLGDWLKRENSTLRRFNPDIRPQGSFRYGTVNRPLYKDDEYDLDNVCVLTTLGKGDLTQEQLKILFGEEIKAYAKAQGILAPVVEHNRCWRLQYADEVNFHLDTLPCVPEEEAFIIQLMNEGVTEELARRAIAITDRRHANYKQLTRLWPSSNPRGFARSFELKTALARDVMVKEGQIRATVEEVPPYEWKTPLQRSIQILKRHRDVMFRDDPDLAPISMIITNLAARAYNGEGDIGMALVNIAERMLEFVRPIRPRVPNPADPFEDYADKWASKPELEHSFRQWHIAVKTDLGRLGTALRAQNVKGAVEQAFDITLTQPELRVLGSNGTSTPSIVLKSAPALVIPSAPRPWGFHA